MNDETVRLDREGRQLAIFCSTGFAHTACFLDIDWCKDTTFRRQSQINHTIFAQKQKKGTLATPPLPFYFFTFSYMFTQLVAPSAVSTAVITDAMICSVHFKVSFLVIVFDF